MVLKKSKDADQEEANFIMQKGNNTAMIHTRNRNVSAYADEDVCMEEPEADGGLNLSEWDRLEEYMAEDVAESDTQYDKSCEDEIRLRSPLRRTPPQIFRKSDKKTEGIGSYLEI